MLRLRVLALLAMAPAACADVGGADAGAASSSEQSIAFAFVPEVPVSADEVYACFAFDATALSGAILHGVQWTAPTGGTVLHHAKLYVTSEQRPTDAAFACDPMPSDAVTLHVWAPGGSQLELPEDVGLHLPSALRTLVVEAHALRVGTEPAGAAQVSVALGSEHPKKVAAWLGLHAPVPALRPLTRETSSSRCRFPAAFHTLLAWPHMHTTGAAFHAVRVRGDDETTLIDVAPWDFAEQPAYVVAVDLLPDDAVVMTCTWQNPTTEYVLPGALTQDEMCNLGLIGWPQEDAACVYEPMNE